MPQVSVGAETPGGLCYPLSSCIWIQSPHSRILSPVLSSFHHTVPDHDGSDSEPPPIMFSTHSPKESIQERRWAPEVIPMRSLHRAGTPPHFGYRRNASREEHLGRGGRAILRPKPLFHAVDEEFESEEESEEEAPAFGSLLSSELRPGRDCNLSHSPLLQRK